jgi:hypothetical protein
MGFLVSSSIVKKKKKKRLKDTFCAKELFVGGFIFYFFLKRLLSFYLYFKENDKLGFCKNVHLIIFFWLA